MQRMCIFTVVHVPCTMLRLIRIVFTLIMLTEARGMYYILFTICFLWIPWVGLCYSSIPWSLRLRCFSAHISTCHCSVAIQSKRFFCKLIIQVRRDFIDFVNIRRQFGTHPTSTLLFLYRELVDLSFYNDLSWIYVAKIRFCYCGRHRRLLDRSS